MITDQLLTEPATRANAIRELATAAAAVPRAISTSVAISRSPAGEWRVVSKADELRDADTSVEISVFRGETADSESLIWRVTWAVNEVSRIVAGR